MANTCNRSICLSREVSAHIQENQEIESFSSWIDEKYRAEFLSLDSKKRILEKHTKEAKKIRLEISILKKFEKIRRASMKKFKKSDPLSKKEIEYFERFDKEKLGSPGIAKHQIKGYMNILHIRVTLIQFLQRVELFQKRED